MSATSFMYKERHLFSGDQVIFIQNLKFSLIKDEFMNGIKIHQLFCCFCSFITFGLIVKLDKLQNEKGSSFWF